MAKSLGQLVEERQNLQDALTDLGITSTVAELNLLDGMKLTATKLGKAIHAAATGYILVTGSKACTAAASFVVTGMGTLKGLVVSQIASGTTTIKNAPYVSGKIISATRAGVYRWKNPSTASSAAGTVRYFAIGIAS